jgi:hypothetical protein
MKRCTQNQILHHVVKTPVPALAVYLIAVLYSIVYFNKLTAVLAFIYRVADPHHLNCRSGSNFSLKCGSNNLLLKRTQIWAHIQLFTLMRI